MYLIWWWDIHNILLVLLNTVTDISRQAVLSNPRRIIAKDKQLKTKVMQVPLKTGQFPTGFVRQCRVAHHYYYAVISVLQPIIYPDAGFLDLLWIPSSC